jgi:comEA protein
VNCAGIDPRITALWGSLDDATDWKPAAFKNANNGSLVIRVDYGASSILVQGDLEDVAIKKLLAKYSHSSLLDVDVYHVGHHGSKNGTTDELLSALSPQMAVIASGDVSRELQWTAWAYGHPNAGIISLLQSHVSAERPSVVTVDAGDGAKKFHHVKIQKDIFDTAWDGSFILETKGDGKWIEVGPSPDSGARININTASEDELKTLPGIGGVRARSILKYREHHGNFASIEDLLKVDGIGPATLNGLREKVVLE